MRTRPGSSQASRSGLVELACPRFVFGHNVFARHVSAWAHVARKKSEISGMTWRTEREERDEQVWNEEAQESTSGV
jgi:hypothetical protein